MSYNQPLSIAFIHPDLGIGGAEKLIINLAIALKQKGHQISIYTPFYDTNHCFQETKNLHIEVHGNLFPRTIFGKMWAFCANMRMLLWVLYTPPNEHFGIVPVECMFLEKIVLALNSGGPKESLKDEECGFLLENKIEKWADKMAWVYENQDKCKEMGKKGKQRAIQMFGFSQFANYIDNFAKDTLLKEIK
ncbi:hypothetical protein IMG5_009400 [Ichthyophthirius multifiliis]|uniref:Glycosyl transferase family 1 domain-containing protein n=1 Tax=Ichthyophthirius multifiliis TaxID=5932 RepID=G0QJV3_ICHMU|nr:hypothetical protein IMG5_009400 [Ichthyophthirius multifiliis]EGR34504.1 hypothetical protein IMG5_009400 [Ichthyophthirius multifiliis]|eukprot:XP_004039808.1 hypothetical protein IMG5_009400 [Ichthyophthirius multifiliis]